MEGDRAIVKKFFDQNLLKKDIWAQCKAFGMKRGFVYYNIKKLSETGSIQERPRSGRPRTAATPRMIKVIRSRIHRNPQRSTRKLAADLKTSKSSVNRILSHRLHFKAYRKRKVHGLSNDQKIARRKRCKVLLERFGSGTVENIIFSDEKLFVVQQSHNAKNDIVYSLSLEDIPEQFRTVQRFQNSSSVMVWGAVSKKGKLPLVFIKKGVKIDQHYYQQKVLQKKLLPGANAIHRNRKWVFQQDSAPAHMAKTTQAWCRANCPDFINYQEWPASSPDLNPLDFCIWGILQAKVNAKQHRSVKSLKRKLKREWKKLSMIHIRAAIDSWRGRLRLAVFAKGGRFEQFLK